MSALLKRGQTYAVFQSLGTLPVSRDFWNMTCRTRHGVFKGQEVSSGQVNIPFRETVIFDICGTELKILLGI